jgi:(p)ppGpp synthase/HD superfamily hydrolase
MSQLGKAIALASKVFESRTDKGGQPYMLHCIRVMFSVSPHTIRMIIAVLHDVVEDTKDDPEPVTLADLYKMGFEERVVTAVGILTHDKSIPYHDYIKPIALNEDALTVKLADLKDNSDITRLKGIGKKDLDRIEQYHKAYLYLSRV